MYTKNINILPYNIKGYSNENLTCGQGLGLWSFCDEPFPFLFTLQKKGYKSQNMMCTDPLQKLPDIRYINMIHTTNSNVFIFEPHTGFSSVSAWWRSMITNFPLVFHSLWARYTFSSSLRIRRSTLSELCRRPSWESAPDTSNSSTNTKFLKSSRSDRWAFIIAYRKFTINTITQSLVPSHRVIQCNTKYGFSICTSCWQNVGLLLFFSANIFKDENKIYCTASKNIISLYLKSFKLEKKVFPLDPLSPT